MNACLCLISIRTSSPLPAYRELALNVERASSDNPVAGGRASVNRLSAFVHVLRQQARFDAATYDQLARDESEP